METQKQTAEYEESPRISEVLVRRSDGQIARGRALEIDQPQDDITHIVRYNVEGKTYTLPFRKGDLEAMQADIERDLNREEHKRRGELSGRLAGEALEATVSK